MRPALLLGSLALAALSASGCADISPGQGRGSTQACTTTAEGYTLCEPSAPLPSGATPPPPPTVVVATQDALAGVQLGMALDAARGQLTAQLGEPDVVEEQGCLRADREDTLDVPLRGQRLRWPGLTVFTTPTASGEQVLSGWEVSRAPEQIWDRYDVRLPFRTHLEQPVRELLRTLPAPRRSLPDSAPDAGALVISTVKAPGVFWVSHDQDEGGVVDVAAYDPEGCR